MNDVIKYLDTQGACMAREILKEALEEPTDFKIAAVIMIHPDGKERFVTYTCEYGDTDGLQNMFELAMNMKLSIHVPPGCRFEVRLLRLDWTKAEPLSCFH